MITVLISIEKGKLLHAASVELNNSNCLNIWRAFSIFIISESKLMAQASKGMKRF